MPEGEPSKKPLIVQKIAETLEGTETLSPQISTLYENYNRSPKVKELDRLEPEYNAWIAEPTIGRGDILDRYNQAELAVKPLRDPINEQNRKRYPDALGINQAQLEDLAAKSQKVRDAYTSLRNRLFDWERRITPDGPPLESAETDVLKALERFNNAIAGKIPNFVAKGPQEIITKLSDELSVPTKSHEEKEEKVIAPAEEAEKSFTKIINDLLEPTEPDKKPVITDPALRRLAKEATQSRNQTPEGLRRLLDRGSDWYLEGKIDEEQWAVLAGVIEDKLTGLQAAEPQPRIEKALGKLEATMERTAQAAEETARRTAGEQIDVLPPEPEKQRKIIMGLVEQVEANDLPIGPVPGIYPSPINSTLAGRINSLSETLHPEVRREAMARLRLQHCAAIADAIPGDTTLAKQYLYSVFLQPESRRYALEGEDLDLLLRKEIPNLKIAEAFNLLQLASTIGIKIEERTLRLTDKNLTLPDEYAILDIIVGRLGGGKNARKSLQLAQRIAKATLETSVWNRDLLGNDPLSEAIYFKKYREQRAKAARDRGPDITIPRIEGFGTSFLRSVQTAEKIKVPGVKEPQSASLFLSQPEDHLSRIATTENHQERTKAILRRNRGEKPGFDEKSPTIETAEPLDVKQMKFSLIKPGEYVGWLGIGVTRTLAFKELLLQSTWKPDDFTSDAIEGWVAPSNAADPEQALRLRPELILGAFHSVFSRPAEAMNYGWDRFSLRAVENNLLRVFRAETGEEASFLNPAQLKWVKTTLKKYYHVNVDHTAAMTGVRIQVTKRVIGR